MVGNVPVGGDAPITIQSMTITKTSDVEGTLQQIYSLAAAGADIVRCTCNEIEAAEGPMGFNAETGAMEDLIAAGVIDPAKVTRAALQNAASIAALILTTEALVADKPEEAPPAMAGGGGGDPMGGMGGMGGMM